MGFKGRAHVQAYPMAGEFQIILLENPRQDNLRLYLSKSHADAVARATPKGQKRVWLLRLFRRKVIGVEVGRVVPVPRIAVGEIDGIKYTPSSRDMKALKFKITSCHSRA